MKKFYRYAMRRGSGILFILAILVVLLSLVNTYQTLEQTQISMGMSLSELRFFSRFQLLLSAIAQSLLLGAIPFAGAVLIDRIDRFIEQKQRPE
jgi:hypothetical protein